MESIDIEIAGRKIPLADWDVTPGSIKLVIEEYHGIITELTNRIATGV
jgi:hypothetical protein